MNLSKRSIFYILFILSALTALGILWFNYAVLFDAIKKTSYQVSQLRSQLEVARAQERYLAEADKELKKAHKSKEQLTFVSFADGRDFIDFIETMASRSNSSIVFDVQNDKAPIFKVQLTGTFSGLISFLRRLMVTPAIIELNQILQKEQGIVTTDLSLTPILSSTSHESATTE